MTAFSAAIARQPVEVVTIPPSAFADDWPDKQSEPIAVGLRLVSESDIQTARAEAARTAIDLHVDDEGRIEAYNDALMRWAVSCGTCDPNDASVSYIDVDNAKLAFTSKGVRYLWDHLERLHLATSPVVAEIDAAGVEELRERLGSPVRGLTPGAEKRLRKLLAFCLEELRS